MIKKITGEQETYLLQTDHTAYAFMIEPSGHPEHLYYGTKIDADQLDELFALRQKREFEPGNVIVYSEEYNTTSLEDICLECSGEGHGDIRDPFIELVHADGSRTTDFRFVSAEITDTKPEFDTLPGSYDKSGRVEHLTLTLADEKLILELHYYVYPKCDVITRSAKLINNSDEIKQLERLLSTQLDLPDHGWAVTAFHGAWAREMDKSTVVPDRGKYIIPSSCSIAPTRARISAPFTASTSSTAATTTPAPRSAPSSRRASYKA